MGKRGYTTEIFCEKAKDTHGTKYDYSLVEYKSSVEKVKIVCGIHGEFEQAPAEHLRGKGCHKCGGSAALDTTSFIDKAITVHGNKYSYENVSYLRSNKKVKITCPEHGDFMQQPALHLFGEGCGKCTKRGYNPANVSCLYVLKFENITKVGITSKPVEERLKYINRLSGKSFELVFYIRLEDGSLPPRIESKALKELRSKYESPKESYHGSTECFLDVDINDLLLKISQICSFELTNKENS